jgi:hypothetical protein
MFLSLKVNLYIVIPFICLLILKIKRPAYRLKIELQCVIFGDIWMKSERVRAIDRSTCVNLCTQKAIFVAVDD